jgi:hypothetical protein
MIEEENKRRTVSRQTSFSELYNLQDEDGNVVPVYDHHGFHKSRLSLHRKMKRSVRPVIPDTIRPDEQQKVVI